MANKEAVDMAPGVTVETEDTGDTASKQHSACSHSGQKVRCDGEPEAVRGHHARCLTDEEWQKLCADQNTVTEFKQAKLEKEAQKNWDLFYKRNTTKFFKDRHWTTREFQELCETRTDGRLLRVLEVGCGVGNFIFPLIEEISDIFFYACDFSPRAVQFVKEHPSYSASRCHAFWCDITTSPLVENIPAQSLDMVTMIFVLSAIHPDKMTDALQNVFKVLRPGGRVLFRDYGLYDFAQLRFSSGHKLQENLYVRQDGTRAYYFSEEKLGELFTGAGYQVAENGYVVRETVNKKEGLCVPRVFVQAKFMRPMEEDCGESVVSHAVCKLQSVTLNSGQTSRSDNSKLTDNCHSSNEPMTNTELPNIEAAQAKSKISEMGLEIER